MTYDNWKTTNPADEFLGPEPREQDDASEIRIVACSCCGGDGGFYEGGNERWTRCTACNGDGELEIELSPVGLDELEFGPYYTTKRD